jgi:hypothetical protein
MYVHMSQEPNRVYWLYENPIGFISFMRTKKKWDWIWNPYRTHWNLRNFPLESNPIEHEIVRSRIFLGFNFLFDWNKICLILFDLTKIIITSKKNRARYYQTFSIKVRHGTIRMNSLVSFNLHIALRVKGFGTKKKLMKRFLASNYAKT